jgi:serum/glucocorticoid-regulated kinase 2
MSPLAADLIKKLMDYDPKKRLGYKGIQEIQNHKFFSGFNWDTRS